MRKIFIFLLCIGLGASLAGGISIVCATGADLKLENPPESLHTDLMDVLKQRQSTREFTAQEIPLRDLSVILWAANGINRVNGKRTAPSAYGKYFIDIYVASGQGVYQYNPAENLLKWVSANNIKGKAGMQGDIKTTSHVLIMVANLREFPIFVGRTERLDMANGTAGAIAENVYLAAAALKLGTRLVGSVNKKNIQVELKLNPDQIPLYIMPLGYPKQ